MATKKLITEACVRELPPGSELRLGPGVLATPAALDLAFQRGFPVLRGEDAPPAAPGSEKQPCLWSRIVSEDGNYLINIRDGRAVVHRVTPEGPVEIARGGGCGCPPAS